jgi:hypothetical protein
MEFYKEVEASIIKSASDWALFLVQKDTEGLGGYRHDLMKSFEWALKTISRKVEAEFKSSQPF